MMDDEQLIEWSYSGKSESDSRVYNRFTDVINRNFEVDEIFLQGSYANSTGILESSDVDIVAVCHGYYINSYDWRTDLKRLKYDMYDALEGANNFHFELGKKTIKYPGSSDYSPVDILPCIPFTDMYGRKGIAFYDHSKDRFVVNYPKQHRDNGVEKNKRTNGSFKKMVRVFKCLRDNLIDEGYLSRKTAPSYFLECLLFNVTDSCYSDHVPDCFISVFRWLFFCRGSIPYMYCQNRITELFDRLNGWNVNDCYKFLDAIYRWIQYA